jgi:Flp pilus assembly protein TadD
MNTGATVSPEPIGWLAAYELALDLMERGKLGPAVDLLRSLALARPRETCVWQALAACHDAAGDSEVADELRNLGSLLGSDETRLS